MRAPDRADPSAAFSSAPTRTDTKQSVATASAAALLPDDTPVDRVIAQLDAAARAGEAMAACRIGNELVRCEKLGFWGARNWSELLALRAAEHQDVSALLPELTRQLERGRRLVEGCARVAPEVKHELPRYHLTAALQGNVQSAAQFVSIAAQPGDLVRDPQLYAMYRLHAWQLFRLAFDAGHPDVLLAWVGAHSGADALAGVMPEDWRKPEVASALFRRAYLGGDDWREVHGRPLSPDQVDEVESLYRQHFEQSPWEPQFPQLAGRPDGFGERLLQEITEPLRLKPCEASTAPHSPLIRRNPSVARSVHARGMGGAERRSGRRADRMLCASSKTTHGRKDERRCSATFEVIASPSPHPKPSAFASLELSASAVATGSR